MEAFLKSKDRDREWLKEEVIQQFYQAIKQAEIINWRGNPEVDREKALADAKAYVEWAADFLTERGFLKMQAFVEKPFKVMVHPALVISGRIDSWFYNDRVIVVDYKGVKKLGNVEKIQLMWYCLGVMGLSKRRVQEAYFLLPYFSTCRKFEFGDNDFKFLLDDLLVAKALLAGCREKGQFLPRASEACQWCGFIGQCEVEKKKGNASVY
jgi:hypothetical protein